MNYTKISRAASLRSARIAADIQTLINNRSYYKFQYTPLTGPLPGLSFEQQTEDAINDIGNMSYGSYEIATQALTTANQAYNAAQSAIEIANHAETTAQNAQTTANNAATAAAGAQETADNAATAAAEAQTTADNAATAAADAQTTADNAQASANTAIEKATDAQTTADNAQNDATSALEKLNRIEPIVDELRYYNDIPDAFDFNTKTEFAREYIQSTECTNAPVPSKGWLDVDDDFDDTIIRHKFIADVDGACYMRFGTIVPGSNPIEVSSWTDWVKYVLASDLNGAVDNLTEQVTEVSTALTAHKDDHNNPHQVTAAQLGLATVYKYKGSVETYADLPTSGQQVGDVYNVKQADPDHNIEAGDNVAWDGEKWDILAGDTDLSGYAQLNAANTFTAANTFNSNIVVRAATAAGSAGVITLGEKPSSKTAQCLINAAGNGNLIFQASENGIIGLQSGSVLQWSVVSDEANTKSSAYLHSTLAATYTPATGVVWEGNAKTATKLATPRTINGVPFDGTKDINIEAGGGGGDVTAEGNNNFTGVNTFNNSTNFGSYIAIANGAGSSASGVINLGRLSGSNQQGATITAVSNGRLEISAGTGEGVKIQTKEEQTDVDIATFTEDRVTLYPNVLQIGTIDSNVKIATGAATTGTYSMQIVEGNVPVAEFRASTNQAAFEATEIKFNSAGIAGAKWSIKNNTTTILDYDGMAMHLRTGNSGVGLELGSGTGGWALQCPAGATDVRVARRLYVGSQGGVGNGVISADNSEQCLYFCGTAENTYYSTPNTGNTISYQASANCYLINCSINNPASLNMNFSGMDFKATVGSVPYMCKTLTFWIAVGATVPTVAWTFPNNSAVYYPKGVAPALTANANNIINVIAIVDDTDSFSIQVCDTVALPFSG
jgi:hypothetical protein